MHQELKALPFYGNSMKPLLKDGDEVLFREISAPLEKGDVLLFKDPENSEFVVHRIIQLNPLLTKGDWSCHEEEVPEENIFGLVTAVKRKGSIYHFSSNKNIIKSCLYFSNLLLKKNSLVRKITRVCFLAIEPLLLIESDL